LPTIEAFLKTGAPGSDPVLLAGVGLMVVGFAFKMSAVPFHAWTPDVYEGSPTPIAAMMSVGTKLAAFSAFLRLFAAALPQIHEHWAVLIWLLAVLTMVIGNVAAIAQTNVKRLLAYSSIAHAGYLLIAVYASRAAVTASGVYTGNGSSGDGLPSLLFYFVVYALMNIGAFAVVTALARSGEENTTFVDFAGLGMRHPWLAGSMTLFLFSLASFPPTAGFWAKFYVFQTALQAGHGELAVIGVLCSLISVFYYLRVVYVMYFLTPSGEPRPFTAPISLSTVVGIAAAGTVLLGFWPTELLTVAQGAKMVF
jgi:NADH-quinone oxidoreductase subunit N